MKVLPQGLSRTEIATVSSQGLWMLDKGADDTICNVTRFEAEPAPPIYSPAATAAASVATMGHQGQVTTLVAAKLGHVSTRPCSSLRVAAPIQASPWHVYQGAAGGVTRQALCRPMA